MSEIEFSRRRFSIFKKLLKLNKGTKWLKYGEHRRIKRSDLAKYLQKVFLELFTMYFKISDLTENMNQNRILDFQSEDVFSISTEYLRINEFAITVT